MEFKPLVLNFIHLFFFFCVLLNYIQIAKTETCRQNAALSNKDCFNDVLVFDNMQCRAGHSAVNKNGVFILEFSNDGETGTRVFYGLKPNGRYLFANESATKEIILEEKNGVVARYESMNAFVALKNDVNKDKEYFMSISTFRCFMEIYDFTKDEVEYDTIYNYNYLDRRIFSFKFELLETSYTGEVIYYLIFCHKNGEEAFGEHLSVKKIAFSSLTFQKSDIIKSNTMVGKLNDRTVTGFIIDDLDDNDYRILIAIYVNDNPQRYKYNVYSLTDLNKKCDAELYSDTLVTDKIGEGGKGHGLFFKTLYLGKQDTAMIYFLSNADNQNPRFQILRIHKDDNCFKLSPPKFYFEITESLKTD